MTHNLTSERKVLGTGQFAPNLPNNLVLKGATVSLEPMSLKHVDALITAASSGELWNLPYTGVPRPNEMRDVVNAAVMQRESGAQFPFVVRLNRNQEIVGTTRYYYIEPANRNLSIGYTWYAQHCHKTSVNTESKFLLLSHAFEKMGCISVQWHTDHRNQRSQAAIRRLGATFEGVLRNHKIMPDGVIRHTHCFSMLDNEWPAAKEYLISRLHHYAR